MTRALILGVTLLLASSSINASSFSFHEVYRQGKNFNLSAYVFLPEESTSPQPALLLFHGGGYRVGQPQMMFDEAEYFREKGMVAIAIQYRLHKNGFSPVDAISDGCYALKWVQDNASRLNIDPRKIVAFGVSAGGHLASTIASGGCRKPSPAISALLLWSPGLVVENNERFRSMLPPESEVSQVAPLALLSAKTPPTSIVHGEKDTIDSLEGPKRYCDQLQKYEVPCVLTVFKNVGHLMSRNLAAQIPGPGFDPDPVAVEQGLAAHLTFIRSLGILEK